MSKKLTTEEFIKKARLVHGDRYDYDNFVYVNNSTKSNITCKKHVDFEQQPQSHLQGYGCFKCSIDERADKHSNKEEFIIKARLVHGDLYDYDDFVYVNSFTKSNITCKKHIDFEQNPNVHLSGKGCPKCGIDKSGGDRGRSNKEEFIIKARLVHGDLYDYDSFVYVNSFTKSNITCKKHIDFEQTASSHLRGHGCPKCTHLISKPETAWLDSLNLPHLQRNISLKLKKRKINVDGYDPNTNTVYQFHGDYWHGNPNRFPDPFAWNARTKCSMHELYKRTIKNDEAIIKTGYNLITKWEND
jgi:hypothetical protein